MARALDLVLIAVSIVGFLALLVYKLALMYHYRDDPAKIQSLVWTDQVFPKRLQRFIYDENADQAGKDSAPTTRLE